MVGAGAAGYSGPQSKRTPITTWHRVPDREGHGRPNYFEHNARNVLLPTNTGSQHGKKTCSTPPGYMTTYVLGNGTLSRGDFAIRQQLYPSRAETRLGRASPVSFRNICDFGIIRV